MLPVERNSSISTLKVTSAFWLSVPHRNGCRRWEWSRQPFFLPVLAPRALHPGLGMETLGGDAFVGDSVQVGDAVLTLFVGWRDLDTDHLRRLRLDQVDQIQ